MRLPTYHGPWALYRLKTSTEGFVQKLATAAQFNSHVSRLREAAAVARDTAIFNSDVELSSGNTSSWIQSYGRRDQGTRLLIITRNSQIVLRLRSASAQLVMVINNPDRPSSCASPLDSARPGHPYYITGRHAQQPQFPPSYSQAPILAPRPPSRWAYGLGTTSGTRSSSSRAPPR